LFPALSDAITGSDAEAVVVALPLPLHAAVVREALLAGKHVLTEKPFTQTLEEAHSLVGIAEKSSRVLMVSQNYRFFAAPQAACQFVRDAWFGQLHTVKIDFRLNAEIRSFGCPQCLRRSDSNRDPSLILSVGTRQHLDTLNRRGCNQIFLARWSIG
jgi:predicted dehydrogenase